MNRRGTKRIIFQNVQRNYISQNVAKKAPLNRLSLFEILTHQKCFLNFFSPKNNRRCCFQLSFSVKANQPVFSGSWVKALLRRIWRILEFQYYDPALTSSWTLLPHTVWSSHQTQPIKLIGPQYFAITPMRFYLSKLSFLMPHWSSLDLKLWPCPERYLGVCSFARLIFHFMLG